MTEVLLALICAHGRGCTEAAQAYYEQRGELRGAVYRAVVIVEHKTPKEVLTAAPLFYVAFGGSAVLSLGKGLYVEFGPSPQLFFKRDF